MGFREVVPASLQEILQNGLLDRTFQDALAPALLWDTLADVKPWGGAVGSTGIFTKSGLMTPATTPITGSDATAQTYGFEQYQVKMDQYGSSIDTNMLLSAMALASKFLEDNKLLAIQAAQSINLLAQGALYSTYGEGQTWVTTASSTSTTLIVNDATGFQNAVVNLATTGSNAAEGLTGQATPTLVPVSGSNPLNVTINGVANTVTGCDVATSTLTLGTAISATIGWSVLSSIASPTIRPNARATANAIVAGDVATLSNFQAAVTRLRSQNVPRIRGAYTAHVTPQTVEELFQDNNFLLAYRGAAESSAYKNFAPGDSMGENGEFMGRFSGIDWILNTVTPSITNIAGVEVYRPIVCGDGALVKAPFSEMADLISAMQAGSTVQVDMIGGVVRILRAPLDRLGQVLSSTWSWVGGYTVGTDILTGDSATYKRAVVVEHA
jgi:hypothetical protein